MIRTQSALALHPEPRDSWWSGQQEFDRRDDARSYLESFSWQLGPWRPAFKNCNTSSEEVEGDDHLFMMGETRASSERHPRGADADVEDTRRLHVPKPSKPRFSNSSWIFGAPQLKFSELIRRMRLRISSRTLGRPPRDPARQRQ